MGRGQRGRHLLSWDALEKPTEPCPALARSHERFVEKEGFTFRSRADAVRLHGMVKFGWEAVSTDLRRMNVALDRARRINFNAGYDIDSGTPSRGKPAMAKAYAPQTCDRIIRRCMQLLGPEGASKDLLLEKWYRDVKIADIFEGSGQVQRIIVAREVVGRLAG